jgi:hypothetical protein
MPPADVVMAAVTIYTCIGTAHSAYGMQDEVQQWNVIRVHSAIAFPIPCPRRSQLAMGEN